MLLITISLLWLGKCELRPSNDRVNIITIRHLKMISETITFKDIHVVVLSFFFFCYHTPFCSKSHTPPNPNLPVVKTLYMLIRRQRGKPNTNLQSACKMFIIKNNCNIVGVYFYTWSLYICSTMKTWHLEHTV